MTKDFSLDLWPLWSSVPQCTPCPSVCIARLDQVVSLLSHFCHHVAGLPVSVLRADRPDRGGADVVFHVWAEERNDSPHLFRQTSRDPPVAPETVGSHITLSVKGNTLTLNSKGMCLSVKGISVLLIKCIFISSRFGCKGKNQVKLKTNVEFSSMLDLSPFLSSSVQNNSFSSYHLYAVVVSKHTHIYYEL